MIYHLIVAVPENFDLEHHLTFRELANIPHTDEIDFYTGDAVELYKFKDERKYTMDVELLKHIASSISTSKVTTLMHQKPEMFEKIAEILNDLGLVIHYKKDHQAAVVSTRIVEGEKFDSTKYLFTCVNVIRITDTKEWNETLQKIVELKDYYPPEEVMKQIAEG